MIRIGIAALAIAGAVAGVAATAAADSDPCDSVPAAQDRLQVATSEWQGTSAAYDIASDMLLSSRFRLYEEVKAERVQYVRAIAAYDDARDACARSK